MSRHLDAYTVTKAASILGYTPQHVRHLIRTGHLLAFKAGRDWLIPRWDLETFKDSSSERPKEASQPSGALKTDNGNKTAWLALNEVYCGDCRELLERIAPNSIQLSVWSPPYHVGKKYESGQSYEEWVDLLETVIRLHYRIIEPGQFVVVNIADILCFEDLSMPRIQADLVSNKRHAVTREMVLQAKKEYPSYDRYQLADLLGCSEQTIDRRLNGNNVRGGKHSCQTRVKLVSALIEDAAIQAGFYLYDRRIWHKDAAWQNSRWHNSSYRSVDEFEYLYFLWKPGVTVIDRNRLSNSEWQEWGSRGVWRFPSVRANDLHEAMFPVELPLRLIKLLTDPGHNVLDCFMGSGTSAVAALRLGRNFIGIEKVRDYVDLAKSRLAFERRRAQSSLFPHRVEPSADVAPHRVPRHVT
ncbi:helix-turn-helix domain-containing protein [bacterium]|nr:helix-turn-helix domain-containing protein [bacterium]